MGGQGQTWESPTPCDDGHAHEEAMGKLSLSVGEEQTCEERQAEPSLSTEKEIRSGSTHFPDEQTGIKTISKPSPDEENGDALSSPSEHSGKQSVAAPPPPPPPRRPAGWATPEPMLSPEPEFTIEASSWPTLAEARHVKLSQIGSSAPKKEAAAVPPSLPAQIVASKVSASQQANSHQERPTQTSKNSNANTFVPGSKYKAPYKKGGFSKQGFAAMENMAVPSVGVHVPSANMFVADQSIKGTALMGVNNFFPGPHQAPAHGPFYYPRAEGLAPFPHNSAALPAYGRGNLGWQHYGRNYADANHKLTGFVPPYDQQHMVPRYTRPPVTPFMNLNVAHHNYPNYQAGDMPFMPGAPSHGFGFVTPYFVPPGPSGGMLQAPNDIPTLQERLQKQIEYYFSTENLCHDTFLTSKMDDEGFVPLSLIASFPRVRSITLNTMLILEAMKNSTIVEVKNGKLRSHDWRRWKPIPPGASGVQGFGRDNTFGSQNRVGSETVRDQENEELEDSQQGHLEKKNSLLENRMIAGSCAAPWTGMSANIVAVSVPTVTSIDSR